jgi:oligopeptide transport system substrate-binding protein
LTLLVGCGGGSKVKVSKTIADYTKGGVVTELEQGYTTLDNQNANAPIDANGYYTYGGKKFKTADTYRTSYSTEPTKDKFNYLCNTWTYNSEHYTNMVDGLVENDKYSNIVGAIAKGYKVEQHEDGTETWTFQLKQGVVWVENESGQEYAEVTAQDFVTGIEYVLDPQNGSGTAGIVMGLIKGSAEYYEAYAAYIAAKEAGDAEAEKPSFETVGVKAIDNYHVAYTLYESTPYFLSSLTYSPFLPVNAEYLASQGTDFGATVNNILVNGAFRVTQHVTNNKMFYTRN